MKSTGCFYVACYTLQTVVAIGTFLLCEVFTSLAVWQSVMLASVAALVCVAIFGVLDFQILKVRLGLR